MKSIIKYFVAALCVAGLFSCDRADYPDRFRQADGKPTVHFVRPADQDVIITSASLEQIICIVGENLKSVHDIYFNDQPAILNTSYMTDNTLLVAVPKNLPVVTTDKMYLITKDSTVVDYDFKVLLPVPKVNGMSFEWASPGETVTITGNYFAEPLTVEFPGAEATSISNVTINSFDVVVPEGAQPGKIKVTTESGTAQSIFQYKDSRGMLFSFDDARGNHGWHAMTIQSDENSLDGNYLQLYDAGGLKADGTDWADTGYHFEYWPGNWNTPETYDDPEGIDLRKVVDFTNFANMALKFEMRIPEDHPWTGCPMQIYFASLSMCTLATANNTYFHDESISLPRVLYKPWKSTGSFDTGGKWITVTFPFSSDFVWYWDGTKATGTLSADSFSGFEIFMAAGEAEGTPCAPLIQIDNIRAVPYK